MGKGVKRAHINSVLYVSTCVVWYKDIFYNISTNFFIQEISEHVVKYVLFNENYLTTNIHTKYQI